MLNIQNSYSTLAVIDIKEAYDFYSKRLLLEVTPIIERFFYLYLSPDDLIVIFEKNTHQASNSAVLSFEVNDIKQTAAELGKLGIKPGQYAEPFQTDEQGISWDENGSHIIWVKDPSDNIISFTEN